MSVAERKQAEDELVALLNRSVTFTEKAGFGRSDHEGR